MIHSQTYISLLCLIVEKIITYSNLLCHITDKAGSHCTDWFEVLTFWSLTAVALEVQTPLRLLVRRRKFCFTCSGSFLFHPTYIYLIGLPRNEWNNLEGPCHITQMKKNKFEYLGYNITCLAYKKWSAISSRSSTCLVLLCLSSDSNLSDASLH